MTHAPKWRHLIDEIGLGRVIGTLSIGIWLEIKLCALCSVNIMWHLVKLRSTIFCNECGFYQMALLFGKDHFWWTLTCTNISITTSIASNEHILYESKHLIISGNSHLFVSLGPSRGLLEWPHVASFNRRIVRQHVVPRHGVLFTTQSVR